MIVGFMFSRSLLVDITIVRRGTEHQFRKTEIAGWVGPTEKGLGIRLSHSAQLQPNRDR